MKKSIALVIGIDEYKNYNKLNCAVNDAKAVAEELERLKYRVYSIYNEDATREGFNNIVDELETELYDTKYDVFVFYFAGHGEMINNSDCLLLHDAELLKGESIKAKNKSIILDDLCKRMRGVGNQLNIFIVDACRVKADENYRGTTNTNINVNDFGKKTTLPYQTFIAFSTSPGDKAGEPIYSEHSRFTQALLNELPKEFQPIETTFKQIRKQLYKYPGQQIPCETSCLVDDFSFNYGQLEIRNYTPYSKDAYNYLTYSSPTINKLRETNDPSLLINRNWKQCSEDEKFVLGTHLLEIIRIQPTSDHIFTVTKLSGLDKDMLCGLFYAIYFQDAKQLSKEKTPVWFWDRLVILTKNNNKYIQDAINYIRQFDSDELRKNFPYLIGNRQPITCLIDVAELDYTTSNNNHIYCVQDISLDDISISPKVLCNEKLLLEAQDFKTKLRECLNIPSSLSSVRFLKNIQTESYVTEINISNLESSLEEYFNYQPPQYVQDELPDGIIYVDEFCINNIFKEDDEIFLDGHCDITITIDIDGDEFNWTAAGKVRILLKNNKHNIWHIEKVVDEHILIDVDYDNL